VPFQLCFCSNANWPRTAHHEFVTTHPLAHDDVSYISYPASCFHRPKLSCESACCYCSIDCTSQHVLALFQHTGGLGSLSRHEDNLLGCSILTIVNRTTITPSASTHCDSRPNAGGALLPDAGCTMHISHNLSRCCLLLLVAFNLDSTPTVPQDLLPSLPLLTRWHPS
jgi:hypothetical protein